MDGHTAHKTVNTPTDFPRTQGSVLYNGQRSWYLRDDNASTTTHYVYRFAGHSPDMPQHLREDHQ
ncbi:hypothetical protein AB0K45_09640 [Micrococcus luteus]|uniref:hypothetical protein n=1 Tax=Micrococcus luteus TaxID=1270 RepID=UPI00341F1772